MGLDHQVSTKSLDKRGIDDGMPTSVKPSNSDQNMETPRWIIEFSRQEIEHLYDRVGCGDLSSEDDVYPDFTLHALKALMLQLASALVAILPPHNAAAVSLSLTENDLWLIKDRVGLADMVGSYNVGLDLSRKICEALLELND